MKIGIMGLGNIAQKAYLPLMGAMQEIDWVLHTRNEETLKSVQTKYNFKETTPNFQEFLNSGIKACFVHTPTHTHYAIIKTLLEHKIHVYVDKPISQNIKETEELIAYAKENKLILMTGFNRRFAPYTKKLKAIENKNMIHIQKHRANTQQDTQFATYDMMIHVIDTALHLLDEEIIEIDTKLIEKNNHFQRAIVNIETQNTSLIATMNMESGANKEIFEVMSKDHVATLFDLNTYTITTPTKQCNQTFPDWTPTLTKRGFENIINHFLETVKKK